jgi:hypothetical protein
MDKVKARDVKKICQAMPKNVFSRLTGKNGNTSATQWKDVERQFKTDCDMAQRILLTPNPNASLLETMDPEYTYGVYDTALETLGEPSTCVSLESYRSPKCFSNVTRSNRKSYRRRKNRRFTKYNSRK